jgi:RNA polymerase sigma factor (sigma-70 family)
MADKPDKFAAETRRNGGPCASSGSMNREQRAAEQLIERARQGDRLAQQELWRLHRRWVAAIILAHRPRSVEVDDLMQDVALKLCDKIDTLRDAGAFRPWLRQIILNVCRGAARSIKPTLSLAESDRPDLNTAVESSGPAPGRSMRPVASQDEAHEDVYERNDAARRLLDQALTLPPEYREPLLLRSLRSMTYQQISVTLGLPITTIETRLARARKMLREELGEDEGNNGMMR